MIGAIVLTFRRKDSLRRQDITTQVSRERDESVELRDVPNFKGVKINDWNYFSSLSFFISCSFYYRNYRNFLNRKNVIVILMSVELILIAVNINLVSFSVYLNDLVGQVFTMFV